MAINTTTSMSSNLYLYYSKKLLDRLVKSLQLVPLGTFSLNIPRGYGKQAKWLRYAERHVSDPASFLLSEGVVPTDATITTNNVTATVQQYGNYAIITDMLDWTAIDPVTDSVMDVLADEAAELADTICRNELDSNLPNQFANNKPNLANTGSSDVMNAKEGLKAMITLKKQNVKPHEKGDYIAVVHPASIGDIFNDTNSGSYVDLRKYDQPEGILNGEMGKAYGVRYLESSNISSTTTGTLAGATVYSNLVLGRGCFGIVRLGKDNIEMHAYDKGNTANPLNQVSTVGYKFLGFVAKYLGGSGNGTEDRGVRVRAGSAY